MSDMYLIMIIALAALAIIDLIVGVSNDAVNFLNSAIGSKAISFKTIMIVASVGIALGAIFSSGMMEVARKGIFVPSQYNFDELMFIFMAVMITDILLLDFFNTLGLPTSTTISIVFELIGASVAMAAIKIGAVQGNYFDIINYINTDKIVEIVLGILLSVVLSFSLGALVQWVARFLLSYDFETKAKYVGAIFGGLALTSITYFIFIKGIKGTSVGKTNFELLGGITIKDFLEHQVVSVVLVSFVIWTAISYALEAFLKANIYKIIIGVGTFALALAFSGNDLVNFIGVPMAAWQSYELWVQSGVSASEFNMVVLEQTVTTPTIALFLSGMIMVVTLWFSKKARYVAETEINLSREGASKERFEPNFLSRGLVRGSILIADGFNALIPESIKTKIDTRFQRPAIILSKEKAYELPAFDMVRAAVNLMVASVLISIATTNKLPLSTTYVTFMVAMGTSLADRAWGAESAVYRVAGVLNVIGGWFLTGISAFIASALILLILKLGGPVFVSLALVGVVLLMVRNYLAYNKKTKQTKEEDQLSLAESTSIQGVIKESADHIASVVKRGNKIFGNAITGLAKQDSATLKKCKKNIEKLSEEVDELRNNIFYFIKNLDDQSVHASKFYINILRYLQDMTQSLDFIVKSTSKHVNNNHKKLKTSQLKELKEIENALDVYYNEIHKAFEKPSFAKMGEIINNQQIFELLSDKIQAQVERTRTDESSPKNTTLYFGLLLETKDLVTATVSLMEEYFEANQTSKVAK